MASVKPYTLQEAQRLISRARQRYTAINARRKLERSLLASGSLADFSVALTAAGVTTPLQDILHVEPDTINRILPALSLQHASIVPKLLDLDVVATAGGENADENASVVRGTLDFLWYKGKGLDAVSRSAWDYLSVGEGVCKVTYERVEVSGKTNADAQDAAYHRGLGEAFGLAAAAGLPLSEVTSHEELLADVPTSATTVERDGVVFSYVDILDFYVDEHASSLSDARWVCQRVVLPLDEVQSNADFKNTDNLVTDGPEGSMSHEWRAAESATGERDCSLTCVLWEFYDARTRTLLIFQEGAKDPLYKGGWNYGYDGFPYSHMVLYRDKPSDFHGFGEIRNIAPLQLTSNDLLGMQLNNAALAAAHKYIYNKDIIELPDDSIEQLTSDEAGALIGLSGVEPGISIESVFTHFQPTALAAEVYGMGDAVVNGIAAVLGQNDFEQGGLGPSRMPGTAAAVVDGISTTRASRKVEAVETQCAEMSQIALAMFREFVGEGHTFRATNDQGHRVGIDTDPSELLGDWDIKVRGSSLAKNSATRKQDALDILNVFAPSLVNLGYDPEPMLRRALSLMDMDPKTYLKKVQQAPPAGPGGPAAAGPPAAPQPLVLPPELDPGVFTGDPSFGPPPNAAMYGAPPNGMLPTEPAPMNPQDLVGGLAHNAQFNGKVAL